MSNSGFGSYNGLSAQDAPLIGIGAGKVPGVKGGTIQAEADALSVSGQDLIRWATAYVWPSDVGELMTLVSTSAADTAVIAVVGLDENFLERVALVALNGLTPVTIPGTWTRINMLDVTGPVAVVGTVTANGNGNIYNYISPDLQVSDVGFYTSPAGNTAQVLSIVASMTRDGGGTDVSVRVGFKFRQVGGVFKKAFALGLQRRGSSSVTVSNTIPNSLVGPIDNIVTATPSATNVSVAVRVAILVQEPRK